MLLISHRGNVEGPVPELENNPNHIMRLLTVYPLLHFEVDVWFSKNNFFLGHDVPQYRITDSFLSNARLWCHAKNLEALMIMLKNPDIHCFWHQADNFTLTSRGYIWTSPGQNLTPKSICVLPEIQSINWRMAAGVCSDFVWEYL